VAPAAPRNIWSFFMKTPEQRDRCKDLFCNSPIGKMTSAAAGPIGAMSGGLIENRCAQKAIDDILKNKDKEGTAEGVAAGIKKSEAEAKARRAAVRFLGTVDCSRFPDAEGVLISSLQDDPNECVRYEAALAFANGCCCNERTIKALMEVIGGKTKVPESSERVKIAAAQALSQCENVVSTAPVIDPKKQEELKKVQLTPEELMEQARETLAVFRASTPAAAVPAGTPVGPQRPTSVAAILSNAFTPGTREPAAASTEMVAQPSADPSKEPAVVNAALTSQSNAAQQAPAHQAPPAFPTSTAVPAERKPFFDNLTRTLKGKQVGRTVSSVEDVGAITAGQPPVIVEGQQPAPVTPQTVAPQSVAPQSPQFAPRSVAPRSIAPQSTAPQSVAPQSSSPVVLPIGLSVGVRTPNQKKGPMMPGFPDLAPIAP
jgi:hypothetical protein